MIKIKNFAKSILNLLGTLLSLLTFGIIKINKSVRREFNVELLKTQLSNMEMNRKENYDKLISRVQDKASTERQLKKLVEEKTNILKELKKAKKDNDTALFTKYAAQLEVKKEIIRCQEDALESYNSAIKNIENTNSQLDLEIEKIKGNIEIINAKKENADIIKENNNIRSKLYMPNGTDNSLNVDEIKEMYDDEVVRENAKSELIEQYMPTISTETFTTQEEMEKFLKENE